MLKRRLLVLTSRLPCPELGDDRIRIMNICKALSTRFRLTLLSLCQSKAELHYQPQDGPFESVHCVYLPQWRSWMNTLLAFSGKRPLQLAYYSSGEFRRLVQALIREHDAVLAHLICTGQYILDAPIPRLLEMPEAISLRYDRLEKSPSVTNWKKPWYRFERKRLLAYEGKVTRYFDRVWMSSESDRSYLDPKRASAIEVIPNGTDLRELPYRPPSAGGNAVVFLGNLTGRASRDACRWFIEQVLPSVRAQAQITFRIIGNAPEPVRRRFESYMGVEITGHGERIADQVEGAFCAVCPTMAAGRTEPRILECMALGLPCISSPEGLRGLDARPGADLLLYRSPGEAVAQILMLHGNAAFRLRLAWAGRQLVCRRYDWESIHQAIAESAIHAGERHPAWRLSRDRHRPAA